jgi:hypothetical protein
MRAAVAFSRTAWSAGSVAFGGAPPGIPGTALLKARRQFVPGQFAVFVVIGKIQQARENGLLFLFDFVGKDGSVVILVHILKDLDRPFLTVVGTVLGFFGRILDRDVLSFCVLSVRVLSFFVPSSDILSIYVLSICGLTDFRLLGRVVIGFGHGGFGHGGFGHGIRGRGIFGHISFGIGNFDFCCFGHRDCLGRGLGVGLGIGAGLGNCTGFGCLVRFRSLFFGPQPAGQSGRHQRRQECSRE